MTDPRDLDRTVDIVATKVESRVTDMIVRLTFLGLFVFWALDLVGAVPAGGDLVGASSRWRCSRCMPGSRRGSAARGGWRP